MPNLLTRAVALIRAQPMLAVAAGGVGLAVAVPVVGRLRQPASAGATSPAANGVASARPLPGDPGDLFASERARQNANVVNAIAAQSRSIMDAIARQASFPNTAPASGGTPAPAGVKPAAALPVLAAQRPASQPTPEPVVLAAAALAPLPVARSGTLASVAQAPTPAVRQVAAPVAPAPAPVTSGKAIGSIAVPSPAPYRAPAPVPSPAPSPTVVKLILGTIRPPPPPAPIPAPAPRRRVTPMGVRPD